MPYQRKRWPCNKPPVFQDAALNVTFACNLSCVGCDRASFIKPTHGPAMTLDRLGTFFEELRQTGTQLRRMRLVGGEPTLHPDFLAMAEMAMQYARSVSPACVVRLFSNRFSDKSQQLVQVVRGMYPDIEIRGARKARSARFPRMTRYPYVSPLDAGIHCPHPCMNMACRGKCGASVDQVGYTICPTGSPIDSILGLNARAKTLKQMLDPEFVRWQTETLCSRCGQFMAYKPRELPPIWDCHGTPVSASYRDALVAKGITVGGPYADKRAGHP